MDVGQIQNATVGMMLFDNYAKCVDQRLKADQKQHGDPLIEAAFEAFEQYASTVEAQNNAMIQGLSTYCLSPKNGGVMTTSQMAPLLALSVLA